MSATATAERARRTVRWPPPRRTGTVLLDNSLDGTARLFTEPERVIEAWRGEDVPDALRAIETALAGGRHVAGVLAYELGYALEPKLAPLLPVADETPLLQVGVFEAPVPAAIAPPSGAARIADWTPLWRPEDYAPTFATVKDFIAAGDVYQINLTFPIDVVVEGAPQSLFADRRSRQPTRYGAYVDLGGSLVLSWSPELFFRVDPDGTITTRPMKGTTPRGRDPLTDLWVRAELVADEKQRAENLMIVDLLRNDIGRIAETGSVRVPDLFTVETYPTLHTLTSGVTGRLKPGIGVADLLRALFPCGSVTGAPKVRAMEIIAELEPRPRGAYCGAIGMFAPDGSALFNVAIRTLTLHPDGSGRHRGSYAVGGGVVADSRGAAEYEEALLKARFLLG